MSGRARLCRVAGPVCIAVLWSGAVAAWAQGSSHAADRFAEGLVALATQERTHEAAAFARLTGVALRNPTKWDDQSERGREAQWRKPKNPVGVARVAFYESLVSEGALAAFSAELELTGTPCVRIADLERASRQKASRGGVAFPIVYDAPSPPPYELGQEHAGLEVTGRSGVVTSIAMEASEPGPQGCLEWISLQSTRPAARPD